MNNNKGSHEGCPYIDVVFLLSFDDWICLAFNHDIVDSIIQ